MLTLFCLSASLCLVCLCACPGWGLFTVCSHLFGTLFELLRICKAEKHVSSGLDIKHCVKQVKKWAVFSALECRGVCLLMELKPYLKPHLKPHFGNSSASLWVHLRWKKIRTWSSSKQTTQHVWATRARGTNTFVPLHLQKMIASQKSKYLVTWHPMREGVTSDLIIWPAIAPGWAGKLLIIKVLILLLHIFQGSKSIISSLFSNLPKNPQFRNDEIQFHGLFPQFSNSVMVL